MLVTVSYTVIQFLSLPQDTQPPPLICVNLVAKFEDLLSARLKAKCMSVV